MYYGVQSSVSLECRLSAWWLREGEQADQLRLSNGWESRLIDLRTARQSSLGTMRYWQQVEAAAASEIDISRLSCVRLLFGKAFF